MLKPPLPIDTNYVPIRGAFGSSSLCRAHPYRQTRRVGWASVPGYCGPPAPGTQHAQPHPEHPCRVLKQAAPEPRPSPSRWPPAVHLVVTRCGQRALPRQHVDGTQLARLAARTQQHIHLAHPRHKVPRRLDRLLIASRHAQRKPCRLQLDTLAAGSQHAVMANPLDPGGQHMQQEAAHKLRPR